VAGSTQHGRRLVGSPPRRARVAGVLAAAAVAGMSLTLSARSTSASIPLDCHGYGGQGPGGYISSLVQSCEQSVQSLLASPPAP